ncbi:MAG TPA: hypothetical protein H9808_06205 [Candidatus Atopostipes pullistercoris]|uniref:Uncharacterized protein n=1 Tax=Candidatus Atopostipes pullistercoris TaxID=2838467 RepID=A0A9D2G2U3_9LACT|nr:hypothetical protein [Candidatus Atopostipes pullistercoris]
MKKIAMSLSAILLLSACGDRPPESEEPEEPTEQQSSENVNEQENEIETPENEQTNETEQNENNGSNQNDEEQIITFVPQKSDLDAGLSVESDETLAELEGLVENADYSEIGIEDDVAIQYTGLYYETDDSIQPIFMLTNKTDQSFTNMDMTVSFKSAEGDPVFDQEKFHLSEDEFGILKPYTSMPLYLTIDPTKLETLENISKTRNEQISIDYFDFETVDEAI